MRKVSSNPQQGNLNNSENQHSNWSRDQWNQFSLLTLNPMSFQQNGPCLSLLMSPACRSLVLRYQNRPFRHVRASSVFSSKDNRTVILTRQDFLPDRTADGDLLFIFSSNILDFRRSLSSYLKFGSRHEDSSRFYR